jgi:hypothetical protein
MPGMDGAGPAGMGPMTGGVRGLCDPYSALHGGYVPYHRPYRAYRGYSGRPRWGMGRGYWGRGAFGVGFRGRGWGRRW